MVQSLSQTGNAANSASPIASALGFGTPIGLGVEGITPGQLNIATPALASAAMGLSMSDLGITASSGQKRNEDEERKAKMRRVLKTIGQSKGRVSEEGIARISRRVGFTFDYSFSEREKAPGDRIVSLGGKKIAVDVDLKKQVPQAVQVLIDTENKNLEEQASSIEKVLLNDLRSYDDVTFHAKLDRFAANLDRLAHIDRSSSTGVNCFEALNGVYTSLRRLYEQESKLAKELHVIRKKSGKPVLHAHGKLGFELEYWIQSAHVGSCDNDPNSVEGHIESIFRLDLNVEPLPAGSYPTLDSFRISDNWLPDPLELPSAESGDPIPWQEPPPTFTSPGSSGDNMALGGEQKLPNLRFIAKLNPPVVVPWQVAISILTSCGSPNPQTFVVPPAWHSAIINPTSTVPCNDAAPNASITSERTILTLCKSGAEREVVHQYFLDVARTTDASYKIEELPFSHPRQLVEVLPILRQWAWLGSLLKEVFSVEAQYPCQNDESMANPGTQLTPTQAVSLTDLLTPPAAAQQLFSAKIPINISLVTSPIPTISLNFPMGAVSKLDNICVQVLPNAELVITSQQSSLSPPDKELTTGLQPNKTDEMSRMKLALEACGNLSVWIEWLRREAVDS
ncbi:MAG: hypothetical protein FE78DRAFT_70420 [Acidomyces sp. 'richmondensis']|nr:MAG: hypothetical protein FE78DRAFT_70420 [Acidomyces sp. 'richmondensis']